MRGRACHVLGEEEYSSRPQNTVDLRYSIRLWLKLGASIAQGAQCRLEYHHVEAVVRVRNVTNVYALVRNRVPNPIVKVKLFRVLRWTADIRAYYAASHQCQEQRKTAIAGAEFEGDTTVKTPSSSQPEI